MPASRDRLSRPIDISTLLPNARRRLNIMVDEPGLRLRGLSSPNVSKAKSSGSVSRIQRHSIQAYRNRVRHNRYLGRLPVDQENRTPGSVRNSQGRRSVLPSWHPRTPLRDISAIVRAIERRRAELQEQRAETSEQESNPTVAPTNSQPENKTNLLTPIPTLVQKNKEIIQDEGVEDPDFITPQKKLLNSIDNVGKIWLEEQQRLERTPAAKRAERARKVRTLMSMR